MLNTLLWHLANLSDLCRRYPLAQRMVTLLAALLLAALLLMSAAILPGLAQPVRIAATLLQQ